MSPSAAPSWPVVRKDEIITSAPARLQTQSRDVFTLDPHSKVRISTTDSGRPYLYVRQGGVQFNAASGPVYICIAGHLFVPAKSAQGIVSLDPAGGVVRSLASGAFAEQGTRACAADVPLNFLSGLPAAAGGAIGGAAGAGAVGLSTSAVIATAAGTAAAGAAVGTSAFVSGSSVSTCTTPSGCNFNPVTISPSQP